MGSITTKDLLNTTENLQAKKEVETNHVSKIGSLDDLDKWTDSL